MFFSSELAPSPTLQVQRKQIHQDPAGGFDSWLLVLLQHGTIEPAEIYALKREPGDYRPEPPPPVYSFFSHSKPDDTWSRGGLKENQKELVQLAVTEIIGDTPSASINSIGAALEMQRRSRRRRQKRSLFVESYKLSGLCFPGRHKAHH